MEKQDKAFTIASDIVKLLITLSTGVITFTVTFSKDLFGNFSNAHCLFLLLVSWIILVCSIIFGFLTLGAMVGNLSKTKKSELEAQSTTTESDTGATHTNQTQEEGTVYSSNITALEFLQMVFFLLGIILVFVFGYINLSIKENPVKESNTKFRIVETKSYKLIDSSKVDTIFIFDK